MRSKIAGVCVTYNVDISDFSENLGIHCRRLSHVFVIDNSDKSSVSADISTICNAISNCTYIGHGGNKGIAAALNEGCNMAIQKGYDWVLTLDQDSLIPSNLLDSYAALLKELPSATLNHLGMITCNMSTWGKTPETGIEEVKMCWTSGALMNLEAYSAVGGFDNELFIDGVDFEICAKLNLAGYRILRDKSVTLKHNLGNTKDFRIGNKHLFFVTNHNPIRRYYMTRNSLYLSKKYGDKFKPLKTSVLKVAKVVFKILLFESDKFAKIRSMYRGYKDYKRNKKGALCLK